MKAFHLIAITLLTLTLAAQSLANNLLPPLDNASTDTDTDGDAAWRTQTWGGNGRFAVVDAGRDGGKCLLVESRRGGDLGWFHRLEVEPNSLYKLSGWIKTENVEPTTGRGVVLELSGNNNSTKPLTGTNDWTRVEVLIRPGSEREIQVNGTFGNRGLATGRAWFDDVQLERIDLDNFKTEITIDATEPKDPINPFVYAQFIEHLGRCIYGGIWAEMLEDRKFYFPITDEYNPYRSLQDSKFPVVGASPWEVVGPAGSVAMVAENPFVGEHTPQVAAASGIRQNDLGFIRGKIYNGYIWVRAPKSDATIKVSLSVVGNDDPPAVVFKVRRTDLQRIDFSLAAPETTDKGQLVVQVDGAPVQIGTVSLMPADNIEGFRADTLALLKQLNAPMYRWPGGNFVSGYDWRDGIGPRDRRPPRGNPAWTGVEHNDVGLDEFMAFCRLVGAEPMVAANTGFGDDYSAAQEVEYTNAGPDTIGGSWRAKNGHPEPYNVKYWCVGNEMFGNWQLGFMALGQYTQKHNRAATAMKKVDRNLVLVGSGDLGTQATLGGGREPRRVNWSQGMLEQCARNMNLISEHFYVWDRNDDIPAHVATIVNNIRNKADGHRRLQHIAPPSGRVFSDSDSDKSFNAIIPIAMDEWNYWFRNYEYGELGCPYQLRDALGIAAGLHEYFRNSDIIHMAHYAQTVNVIGCIKTTKTEAFFDPTALPLLLYRREFGTHPLKVTGNHDVLALDVAAARTEDGSEVTIGVVNPNAKPQKLNVKLNGLALADTAKVWRIAGNDPTATNTAEKHAVTIADEATIPFGDELEVPAYSINIYRVAVN